jgi:hypothetical protein
LPNERKRRERGRVMSTKTYEVFLDSSYYDMWCVRSVDDTRFDSPFSFHFVTYTDALLFKELIEKAL